jgi:hypothetical protein
MSKKHTFQKSEEQESINKKLKKCLCSVVQFSLECHVYNEQDNMNGKFFLITSYLKKENCKQFSLNN